MQPMYFCSSILNLEDLNGQINWYYLFAQYDKTSLLLQFLWMLQPFFSPDHTHPVPKKEAATR